MRKLIISLSVLIFLLILVLDISGVFKNSDQKFFSRKEISKYAQDMVFCSSIESITAFAIRTDEQNFRNICSEKLGFNDDFGRDIRLCPSLPLYRGGANEESNANYYWWFLFLKGDLIIASRTEKNYEITVAFNTEQNIAFFYFEHLRLWGTVFSNSHVSAPRGSRDLKAAGYWRRM
ncbi:MAG: hypothetical protein PF692_04020 [Kiritimatiellae bacterium]|jgi:hypothetical protein|nr:hypothetical protein [Kiritimatiellia bacterium]